MTSEQSIGSKCTLSIKFEINIEFSQKSFRNAYGTHSAREQTDICSLDNNQEHDYTKGIDMNKPLNKKSNRKGNVSESYEGCEVASPQDEWTYEGRRNGETPSKT